MKTLLKTLLLSLALTVSSMAFSKELLKIYIAAPPGGFNDIMLRKIQSLTPENSKFNIHIEYKPGGDGLIAMNAFIADRSPHALLFVGGTLVNKASENEKTLQEFKDLMPVAYLYEFGTAFVTNNDSKFKTWDDVIAEANSGRPLNVGAANGILARVAEGFFSKYPNVTVVPFAGDRNTLMSVLSNSVHVGHLTSVGATTPVEQNQVRGVLVTHGKGIGGMPTADKYKATFPFLPIVGGFSARQGTSKELVEEYNKFLTTMSNHPEMLELYQKNAVGLPRNTTPANFERVIDRLYKEAKVK